MSSVQLPPCVWHVPFMQVPVHVTPQPPQFALSLPIVSTQLPEQQLCDPQGFPQPPQLFGSLVMSTHVSLQHVLASPRQPLPQLPPPPVSTEPPVSFGGDASFGGLESLPLLESCFVPESEFEESSAAVPVAHAASRKPTKRHTPAARMERPRRLES